MQVPHLKTSFQATIGTQAIAHIQKALIYICKGMDNKELERKVAAGESLSEQEQCAVYLTGILRAVYKEAEEQGQVTYKPLELPQITE